MRVVCTSWFERFARRHGLSANALRDAVTRADKGLVDADLGGGVIKQRIARPGSGRSGGFRVLVLYRRGDRAIFAFGYEKNRRANIGGKDLDLLRSLASIQLALSEFEIGRLVEARQLLEVTHGEDE